MRLATAAKDPSPENSAKVWLHASALVELAEHNTTTACRTWPRVAATGPRRKRGPGGWR